MPEIIQNHIEPSAPPLVWNITEAASRLRLAPITIRRLLRQERLSRVPGVRKILIPESSLVAFVGTAENHTEAVAA